MAGNREQQMYEITKQLEEGVKALFTSERYTEYLKTILTKEKQKSRERYHRKRYKNPEFLSMLQNVWNFLLWGNIMKI